MKGELEKTPQNRQRRSNQQLNAEMMTLQEAENEVARLRARLRTLHARGTHADSFAQANSL